MGQMIKKKKTKKKKQEDINYTVVKHENTFYGRETAFTPAVVKINIFWKCWPLRAINKFISN